MLLSSEYLSDKSVTTEDKYLFTGFFTGFIILYAGAAAYIITTASSELVCVPPPVLLGANLKATSVVAGIAGSTTKLAAGAGVVKAGITAASAFVYLTPALALVVGGAAVYYGHDTYRYITRYPQPKDAIESAVNKLNTLRLAKQLNGLKNCIVDGYSVGWWTSSTSSSQLYNRARTVSNNEDIFEDVVKYLTRTDDNGSYHNNGKRLFNLLLHWIGQQPDPKLQIHYVCSPHQSTSSFFHQSQQSNSATAILPPEITASPQLL